MKNLGLVSRGEALRLAAAVACLSTIVIAGCTGQLTESGDEPTSQITVALTQVPSDVACVELTVTGTTTVTQLFDVTAGQATMLTMSGLPIGPVTVDETTFAVPCSQVTAKTPASWVSQGPVMTTLVAGGSSGVTIVMRRSSQLVVTTDFQSSATALVVSPSAQDFGSVPDGQTVAVTFTVTNSSSSGVTFGSAFSGVNASDFTVVGGSCAAVATLASGASCSLLVQFAPTTTGAEAATLAVGNPALVSVALTGTGTPGSAVTISPVKSDDKGGFNGIGIGGTLRGTVTVTNGGTTGFAWAATLSGPDASSFTLPGTGTCTALTTLAAGASCTLDINFQPFSVGSKVVTLSVGSPVVASSVITAAGKLGTLLPVSPSSNDFGSVPVGQAVFATFTVTSQATAIFPNGGPTIVGPDAPQFSIVGNACGDGSQLQMGQSCTVSVVFAPKSIGAKTATFNFNGQGAATLTGAGAAGSAVTLSAPVGTGKGGSLSTSIGGSTSALVTVTNGGATAFAWAAAFSGADVANNYTLSGGTCASLTSLAAGASCTVGFTFAPFVPGPKTVTLSVGAPVVASSVISLFANVNNEFSIAPASNDFGSVALGQSAFVVFTATNISGSDIAGGTPSIIGPDAAQFAIIGGTCGSGIDRPPGAICTAVVKFTPTSVGAKAATFNFFAGGAAVLAGTGAPGSTAVTISAPKPTGKGSASNVPIGASGSFTVTVTNGGTTALPWSDALTGGDVANNYTLAGGTCATLTSLAAGASCTVGFTFAPFSVGAKTVTLSVGSPVVASSVITLLASVGTQFTISPASSDFGSVAVGQAAGVVFTLTNVSGSTISGATTPSIIGPDAVQFAIIGGTCGSGLTFAPAASCTVAVKFVPTTVGAKVATFDFFGQAAAALTGVGTAGSTAVTITAPKGTGKLGFTDASVASSLGGIVTVTNGGTTALPWAAALSGPDATSFSLPGTGTCATLTSLAAGASCTLGINFVPWSVGTKVATLAVGAPVAASIAMSLVATSGGLLPLTPAAATFSSVAVGSSSTATFTTTNMSTAAAPFSSSIVGPDKSQFAITGGTCAGVASLAVGASCTLTVTFTPTSTGTKNAGLVVGTGQGASTLTGTGM